MRCAMMVPFSRRLSGSRTTLAVDGELSVDEAINDLNALAQSLLATLLEADHVGGMSELFGVLGPRRAPCDIAQTPEGALVLNQLLLSILDFVEAAFALVGESIMPEQAGADAAEIAGELAIAVLAERTESATDEAGVTNIFHFEHLFHGD